MHFFRYVCAARKMKGKVKKEDAAFLCFKAKVMGLIEVVDFLKSIVSLSTTFEIFSTFFPFVFPMRLIYMMRTKGQIMISEDVNLMK